MTEQVFVRQRFWSADECADLRLAMDRGARSPAEVFDRDFVVRPDVRNALDVEPADEAVAFVAMSLESAMPEVARHFGLALQASEGAGFLRYEVGGLYKMHRDVIAHDADAFPRQISVVVFLSAVQGGELRLYFDERVDPVEVVPVPGMLVAFRSEILHEVRPVCAGVRDVVVDWYY